MLSELQTLTTNLQIYSVRLISQEQPDFHSDALAGVRANYFRSGGEPQQDKTELELDGRQLRLQYSMQAGKVLSWKITRARQPFQTVKPGGDGYCVITYRDDGVVYKRSYFDNSHRWQRTDYFRQDNGSAFQASISPMVIKNVTVLRLERVDDSGVRTVELLYPSAQRVGECAALLYGSTGMLWYDASFAPDQAQNRSEAPSGGFRFSESDFDHPSAPPLDVQNAAYLSEEDIIGQPEPTEPAEAEAPVVTGEPKPYSAYEKIRNILLEAQKANKNLLGEVAAYTEATAEPPQEPVEEPTETAVEEPQTEEPKPEFVPGEPEEAVLELQTPGGTYAYYGELDEQNRRIGRGRTAAPDGTIVYDGEYRDDKRSGFGVSYYKDGSPNYFGDWHDGKRSGRGAGFRQSDGTMHAGRWLDNAPDGIGARFDSDGSFLDVCRYENGTRNGKSVSFDENGNVVIKVWENGELISEQTITDGE